jgi:hypothetical protein
MWCDEQKIIEGNDRHVFAFEFEILATVLLHVVSLLSYVFLVLVHCELCVLNSLDNFNDFCCVVCCVIIIILSAYLLWQSGRL